MQSSSATEIVAAAEALRRNGDPLGLFEFASHALEQGHQDSRLRYLKVLALAQMGDCDHAERLYRDYRLADSGEEDALALGGRLAKDRALAAAGATRSALFRAASDAYLAAYALRSGYFPGINAASTAWAAGDRERARELAAKILADPEVAMPDGFYAAATRAEALLLLGRCEEAAAAVEAALRQPGAGDGERASAYRQLAWLHRDQGVGGDGAEALLARLRPPPVITYCGHMFGEDAELEAALGRRIAAELDALGAHSFYGALACGGDIMVAEEVVRRGCELNVVLPFAQEDFVRESVAPGGQGWLRRFHRCLAAAAGLTFASRMVYIGHDEQFGYGSMLTMGLARLRARQLCTEAVQLAVWDGDPASGRAGTGADVALWRGGGGITIAVPPGPADRKLSRAASGQAYQGPPRVIRAIIFTDFAGFSRLSEKALPEFWREIMGRVAQIVDAHADAVCSRDTWGDALYLVIEDAPTAAEIALEIQDALREASFADAELRAGEGMRIGVHFGPVYADFDPVSRSPTFYGSEVTLTARIEPKVPSGEIYVTQPFAAILASAAPDRFASHYVGRIALAKGYGEWPIYQLGRAPAASG
ncbi:MAG TPA: adenylate/guanylate cyclase domain-containing protein [Allosphingosinicella sp.]|nr:adenylate/guanylate cyclase domain-containing protein [Allosphingosinicella sp.]